MVTIPVFILLMCVGLLAGIAAGLLGVGGGIVTTPFCAIIYPKLGVHPEILHKVIFGTNFFMISFSSLISSFRYHVRGLVLWKGVFPIAAFSIFGAFAGAAFAALVPDIFLRRLFGAFMLLVGIRMFIDYKVDSEKEPSFYLPALALTGFSTAVFSTMIGVGGGILTIPIMIFLLRYPVRKAPGTSSSIIVFTSIAAMIGYAVSGWNDLRIADGAFGYVHLEFGMPLMCGAIVGAPIGTWINQKISTRRLKQVFGLFMFIMFVKMAFF
ncbi:sulfite exporter TauE/SafE family protein [candidate division KSB1 bacterium]